MCYNVLAAAFCGRKGKRMGKRMDKRRTIGRFVLCVLCVFCALCTPQRGVCAEETQEKAPVLRALFLSCDTFVTRESTDNCARQSSEALARAFAQDAREYERIALYHDEINLEALLLDTFSEAQDEDICLICLTTHGEYNPARSNGEARLVLSDGQTEREITARELERMVENLHGHVILLLDCCHSGAFIGKGLSQSADENLFLSGKSAVLCACGGSEQSWYWSSSRLNKGMSYFSSILLNAIDIQSGCPADYNADGIVSMGEALAYLEENYGASTPCLLCPQGAADTLFAYEREKSGAGGLVCDLSVEEEPLIAPQGEAEITLILRRDAQVYYQILYEKNGVWDFENAAVLQDEKGEAGYRRRQLRLTLPDEDEDSGGYALLQVFTLEQGNIRLWCNKLIRVWPAMSDAALSVDTGEGFCPDANGELAIFVRHDVPCKITVQVYNASGRLVRTVAENLSTRPCHLTPSGTAVYWDGRDGDGKICPNGAYYARVTVETSTDSRVLYSLPFMLR